MADAKKCDRCGKYYDVKDRTVYLYDGSPHRNDPLDLCDECAADLKKWLDKDMGDVSDGYHTFNELYHHRAVLFANICNGSSQAWKSKKHHDGSMYENIFIVGLNTKYGQITYHYDIDPYWDLFQCAELKTAPKWDGHTSYQVVKRLMKLAEDIHE